MSAGHWILWLIAKLSLYFVVSTVLVVGFLMYCHAVGLLDYWQPKEEDDGRPFIRK